MTEAAEHPHRPWALALLWPLMAAGAGIGVYMARHHEIELYGGEAYAGETLVGCAEAEGVSCNIVNTSAWSEVFGVPTFAWAVPTYLLVAVLAFLAFRGRHGAKTLLLGIGLATVAFSGWLFYVSKVELGYVCLWCMRLYAINAAIPVLALVSGMRRSDLPDGRTLGTAAATFALLAGVTVGIQQAFRAQLLGDGAGADKLVAADAALDEADDEGIVADPEGLAPERTISVRTEDGNTADLVIRPGDAWKGNPDAKVTLVEFADFECGYCKRAGSQLRRLYEAYKDDLLFVYKHFPMDPACNPGVNNKRHRHACWAHVASECAKDQGKFWAYHDLLYKNNHQLGNENLRAYAEAVELDLGRFDSCMRAREGLDAVKQAGTDGAAVDTHGTPRIWIGDQLYRSGSSAEQMARAIEAALGHSTAEAAENAAKVREERPSARPIPADVPAMRRVTKGDLDFRIDTFEASLEGGAAVSGLRRIPATRMSWYAAADACEQAGKRMCTEEEWVAACQGAAPVDDDQDGEFADDMIEGTAYPYSDFHLPGVCWDGRDGPDHPTLGPWRPVFTGEMPACATPEGVYDMTGNVEEWVGATPDESALLGGAFDTPDDHARCYRRNDTFGAGYANQRTGFRCCQSVE